MKAALPPEVLRDALAAVGLRAGDLALLHSDARVAAQFAATSDEQRLDLLIEAVESALGPQGTLLMPTFSYSFTKGEVFDVRSTPSTVGMVTERFRTRPGVLRTADPIFSFAVKGPRSKELCALPAKECFGPESVFAALHRLNGLIVCLACQLTSATFVHYVEKCRQVDYRYDKVFSGTVIQPDGQTCTTSVVYYVRDLARATRANLQRLCRRLQAEGLLRTAAVGRVQVLGVRAADFLTTASKMLDEDASSLIEEGASP